MLGSGLVLVMWMQDSITSTVLCLVSYSSIELALPHSQIHASNYTRGKTSIHTCTTVYVHNTVNLQGHFSRACSSVLYD